MTFYNTSHYEIIFFFRLNKRIKSHLSNIHYVCYDKLIQQKSLFQDLTNFAEIQHQIQSQ